MGQVFKIPGLYAVFVDVTITNFLSESSWAFLECLMTLSFLT